MTSPLHPSFAALGHIDWNDTTSILRGCTPLFQALASDPILLAALVAGVAEDSHLADMCEGYDFMHKLVLYDVADLGVRLRLHVYQAGFFDRPHNHRWSFASHILRGGYTHRIFGRDDQFGEDTDPDSLLPIHERLEQPGSTYALHHTSVHTVQAEADTISLLVRGPSAKQRFLILDAAAGGFFWVYGAAQESPEQRASKRLTPDQLTNTITRIQRLIATSIRRADPQLSTEGRDTVTDDDAWQGMLFGATSAEGETTEDGPIDELRVCALNVNSPSPSRAQRIVDWLLATKSNTLVLTEMQLSEGGRHMLACLQAEGCTTTCTPGWKEAWYFAAVATRGVEAVPVQPAGFDPRVAAVDLTNDATTVRLVGLYGPTNGMTAESSHRRREFQSRFLDYLAEINNSALCVVGDLSVVEPNHRPHLPAFEDHDYAFYTGLLALGLRDAYRELNPTGGDHSWINPRFGSQRLDHSLISDGAGDVRACAYDHTTRRDDLSDHAALLTTIGLRADRAATNGHRPW